MRQSMKYLIRTSILVAAIAATAVYVTRPVVEQFEVTTTADSLIYTDAVEVAAQIPEFMDNLIEQLVFNELVTSVVDDVPYVYGIMQLPARRDNAYITQVANIYVAEQESIRIAVELAAFEEREITCLATVLYHEARGESAAGQIAVGQVVITRRDQPQWPDTVCRVVYQKGRNAAGKMIGQFAWSTENLRIRERDAYNTMHAIAIDLYHNYETIEDQTEGSQYFLSQGIFPGWVRNFEEVLDLGGHKFYRDNRIVTMTTKG